MEHEDEFDDVLVEHNFYQGVNTITVRNNDHFDCIDIIATRDPIGEPNKEEVTMCVSLTHEDWYDLVSELEDFVECEDTEGLAINRHDCFGRSKAQLIVTDDSFMLFNLEEDEVISVSAAAIVKKFLSNVVMIV